MTASTTAYTMVSPMPGRSNEKIFSTYRTDSLESHCLCTNGSNSVCATVYAYLELVLLHMKYSKMLHSLASPIQQLKKFLEMYVHQITAAIYMYLQCVFMNRSNVVRVTKVDKLAMVIALNMQ